MTPVMLAARNGHKDVIWILIERGANLDLVDSVSVYVYYKSRASSFLI